DRVSNLHVFLRHQASLHRIVQISVPLIQSLSKVFVIQRSAVDVEPNKYSGGTEPKGLLFILTLISMPGMQLSKKLVQELAIVFRLALRKNEDSFGDTPSEDVIVHGQGVEFRCCELMNCSYESRAE